MTGRSSWNVTIVGAGFSGLAAGYELAKAGVPVTVLEAERDVGGLAAAFDVGGEKLDRFYHHWFTNDVHVMALIDELGLNGRVEINATNTGIYYANQFFRLSTPLDLLKFGALPLPQRIRLGLLALRARRVRDWKGLESRSAREWLVELGGEQVYRVVWEPLLKGKFGPYADDVSAVWFWNKLKLRGGSRGKAGEERLAYFRGGFVVLAQALAQEIRKLGGRVELGTPALSVQRGPSRWEVTTPAGPIFSDQVVLTTALPAAANLVRSWATPEFIGSLKRIRYIGNVCLVLELDRRLSDTYWLNVNDPQFPFVGVIEHTNFERPETYGGRHIVYLSKYLPDSDPLYAMEPEGFLEYALPFLQRMFPALERSWIRAHHLWRARWSQPIVEKNYGALLQALEVLPDGLHLCSMAQIYPEDRGTNYAIREGRRLAQALLASNGSAGA